MQGLVSNKEEIILSRRSHFLILLILPLTFLALAFIFDTPANIFSGLDKIIWAPDILLTDYLAVGGFGAALFNVLGSLGIKVIEGGKTLSRNYPEDIAYNVARIGRYAVHNTRHTDQVLRYYLEEAGIEFIHVNQGYTKCSVAALSDNKALTSDFLIHEKLKSFNIDCMYVNPKFIRLKGYDNGFIGGSTGLIDEKIFLSTGKIFDEDISLDLKKFIESAGYIYEEASSQQITDLGTLIPII
jgi:hypothetical protein